MNKDEIVHTLKNDPKAAELRTYFLDKLSPNDFDRLVDDHLITPSSWDEGDYTTSDGWQLRYTFSSCANPKALLVVLQGRAQSAHEYYDFINRAHDQGYAVFTFDRRSHGNSQSYFTDGRTDHHILDIRLQVSDVAEIMGNVVKKSPYDGLPRAIIGHSMGGAETASHLKTYQHDFNAAVYLAPMFAIHRHPNFFLNNALKYISPLILGVQQMRERMENRVFGRDPWNMQVEKETFSPRKSNDGVGKSIQPTITVLERAKQVGTPSWGTAQECLRMTKEIQRHGFFDDIKTPSLCLLAEQDEAVDTPLMLEMNKNVDMETVLMPGRHQTLNEVSDIKENAYTRMFKFLKMHL
jgi:alpha-beta hydrolase superfamily lysophospholipase